MTVINKSLLMSHIQAISGLLATSVVWEHDPRPMISDVDRSLLTLMIKNSDYLGGADDKRRTFDSGTNTFTLELTGQRSFILELRAEAFDKSVEAYEILERVRTLFNGNLELSPTMTYQTCNLIVDLPTAYDNRVVSVAVLELQLGVVSSYVAKQQVGQGWISTVNTDDEVPGSFS